MYKNITKKVQYINKKFTKQLIALLLFILSRSRNDQQKF